MLLSKARLTLCEKSPKRITIIHKQQIISEMSATVLYIWMGFGEMNAHAAETTLFTCISFQDHKYKVQSMAYAFLELPLLIII